MIKYTPPDKKVQNWIATLALKQSGVLVASEQWCLGLTDDNRLREIVSDMMDYKEQIRREQRAIKDKWEKKDLGRYTCAVCGVGPVTIYESDKRYCRDCFDKAFPPNSLDISRK